MESHVTLISSSVPILQGRMIGDGRAGSSIVRHELNTQLSLTWAFLDRVKPRLAAAAISASLAGCAGFTPQDAPNAVSVKTNAALTSAPSAQVPYAVVPINPEILRASNLVTDNPIGSFAKLPGGNYRDVTIGVGDVVAVTVFEAQPGGLFIPREASVRPGNFVDIPKQQVDQSGNINVPYAGPIKVSGITTRAAGNIIREKLKDRAIDPQIVVSVAEQRGNQISILGEVNAPLRFAADPGGIRLMSAIARAGGPKYPAYETKVTIRRNGRAYVQAMSAVVQRPNEDAPLGPGDVVYLSREPRVFMVLGATPSPGSIGGTNNRRFTFENDNMTLAEAVAKAGGLDGLRADSRSLYVMRYEPKPLLE
ncbi:MAG: polysaccharide export protein, partial [Bradyrhizobium sp.]|nr:polysaccharide export protein [Bradyrhizobium sp.]